MQDKANTPAKINETQLDDISGGPHFRNFHGAAYDFAVAPDDTDTEASGHYTQVVWAKTR